MAFVTERTIGRISFFYAIIVVAVMTFSTGGIFILRKYKGLQEDLKMLESQFILSQKELLKKDVLDLIDRIDNRVEHQEAFFKANLKNRVEKIHAVSHNLYQALVATTDHASIELAVREAIRPIRVNQDDGYCFILNKNGVAVLYPMDPDLEGVNLKYQLAGEAPIINDLITTARTGGGYFQYDWYKPELESDERYPKLVYLTFFKELGWILGCGEYLDDLDNLSRSTVATELQSDIAARINDYLFVFELHNLEGGEDFATVIVNNNRPDLIGKKIADTYQDNEGKQFNHLFLDNIKENQEAYITYSFNNPSGGTDRKLSYFKLYPRWNWIVAKGVYFDHLEQLLASQKQELTKKVKDDLFLLVILFFSAVFIALVIAYFFSRDLQKIVNAYKKEQQKVLYDLENLNQTLEKQSKTDPLTGIANRNHLNAVLEHETKRASRYRTPLSILLFDIDHFKAINDDFGHLSGDTILRQLSTLVGDNIRSTDIFARWGGEEFMIVCPGTHAKESLALAEKLRALVETSAFAVERTVTISFGVAAYAPTDTITSLLQRTDEALYLAKNKGRNRVEAAPG